MCIRDSGALDALKAMVAFVNPRVAGCRVIAVLIGDVAKHGLETGLSVVKTACRWRSFIREKSFSITCFRIFKISSFKNAMN